MEQKKQYLVIESANSEFPPGAILDQLLDNVRMNENVSLVRTSCDGNKPTLVVLKTKPEIMEALGTEFAGSILFEEDRVLTPF